MKCKDYRKWVHLNREGELTPRQAAKLERHLRRCPSCAAQKLAVEKTDRIIQAARTAVPQPSDPEALTDQIMSAIEPSSTTVQVLPSAVETRGWFDWLYLPKVRLAMVAMVIVILGLFIFQGTMILHRISRLEEKIAVHSGTQAEIDTVLSKRVTRARIARILEQAEFIYQNLPGDDDRVVIRKSTLRRLLRLLIKPQPGDERFIRQLLLQISLLNEIDIENGIEKKELKKIVEKKQEILKKIYKF